MSRIMVVTPLETGPNWVHAGRSLVVLGTTSKDAALAALRRQGYRIMHRGGLHEAYIMRVGDFQDQAVYSQLREAGLDEQEDILERVMTVYPSVRERRRARQ